MIPTVYIVAGPTAVGKTAAAIELAQKLDTVIISTDSRQCYKEMNIGVARPSANELASIKHYFVNEFPIITNLNAADFEQIALNHLYTLFNQHQAVVVCGGTGLYIKALCEGLDDMPPVDKNIDTQVEEEYEEKGLEWLQEAIKSEDPAFYTIGEIQNPVRMLRALSFIRSNGRSITVYRTQTKKNRPFRIIKVGLEMPRQELYDRINQRVDTMITNGLLKEAQQLYPHRHLKNLQTVGYVELFDYLDGKCTLPEAVDKIKQHTRNYAKRQLTWFKKDPEFIWFPPNKPGLIEDILSLE